MATSKRFVILSGPSGVGKGPLQRAVERLYPGKLKARPVLSTSRPPRGREVHGRDYYFLPESFIRSLGSSPDFVVSLVRSDWQAIHLVQVGELLDSNELVFVEAFYTFGQPLLPKATARGIAVSSVFLVPVEPGTPPDTIVSTMRAKLDRRGTDDEKKKEERAGDAPKELQKSADYTHVLLNTVGEDDVDEWGEFGTLFDKPGTRSIQKLTDLGPRAKWLVDQFVKILDGNLPPGYHRP